MNTAIDPLTGESFIKQRNNQVFANRQNQIKYNNLKAMNKRKSIANISRILDKNRTVLKTILGDKTEITKSLDFLLGAGFNFGCSTHSINHDEKKWVCIYDYAYTLIYEKTFKIIKFK